MIFCCFCFFRSRLWGLCKNVCFAVVVSRIDVSLHSASCYYGKTGFFSCFFSLHPQLLFIDWKWKWYFDLFPSIFPSQHPPKVKRWERENDFFLFTHIKQLKFIFVRIMSDERNSSKFDEPCRWNKSIQFSFISQTPDRGSECKRTPTAYATELNRLTWNSLWWT